MFPNQIWSLYAAVAIVYFLVFFFAMLLFMTGGCDINCHVSGDDDSDSDLDGLGDDDSYDDDDNYEKTFFQPTVLDGDDFNRKCENIGEITCSEDGYELLECVKYKWTAKERCMADFGQLCEDKNCVDPWLYGAPEFDPCQNDPDATAMSLYEKAVRYDDLAINLHVHPDHKRINHVTLDVGYTEDNATYENVVDWHTGENDGLWTGLYIASQAFRYAATEDPEALDNLELMMDGMGIGMEITGVDGVFTREYITPGITGMSCPSDPNEYIPDIEKDDNRWVKVDTDGTILIYDGYSWERTTHVAPMKYAGYCWLDNVSQDEYAGHMLALGSIYYLVDDPDIKAAAADLLEKIGLHLLLNGMAFRDWDGRLVEHGRLWPLALDDFPGFNAVLGLSFIKMAATASGRKDLDDFYHNCLLQEQGQVDCLPHPLTPPMDFSFWAKFTGLYLTRGACKANWNNFAMIFIGMFTLQMYEHDPALHWEMGEIFENEMFFHNDNKREMAKQLNAGWNILFASMKNLGPGSTGQDIGAVNTAICALRQFPESKTIPDLDVGESEFPSDVGCVDRFGTNFLTLDPVPVHQRCPATFTWWHNPYRHQHCSENLSYIKQPSDYLLPYWMTRYFGYIDETM